MSTVTVNLSQTTWDTIVAMRTQNGQSPLAQNLDVFFLAGHAFSAGHPYYSSATLAGTTGRLNFPDSGYLLYSGIAGLAPNADQGKATATNIEEYAPNAFRLTYGGKFTLDYSATGSTVIAGTGGTVTAVTLETLVPATSTVYDDKLGNVTLSMHGTLDTDPTGHFTGTVTAFDARADSFLTSSNISGKFAVTGSSVDIGMSLATTTLAGTLTGFSNNYTDGSQLTMSGASLAVTGATVFDERMFADPLVFGGNDVISVTLPDAVSTPWLIASGAGDDSITLKGGGGALDVLGGAGNDSITLRDGGHEVDGGDGMDTVSLAGARTAYTITKTGGAYVVAAAGQASSVVQHVETLKFAGSSLSLDYEDVVQALYVAYFGRAADTGGLANFQQQLAALNAPHDIAGVSSAYNANPGIRALIDGFGTSDESKALYSGTTIKFVTAIYKNIFSRAPDSEGLTYWVDAIDHHGLTKANASLSIMAGALSNTSTQGMLDAALVNNRTAIASDFSLAIDTPAETLGYVGNAAAATVRAMLASVDANTDLAAFQATVHATLDGLATAQASLVGVVSHEAPFLA